MLEKSALRCSKTPLYEDIPISNFFGCLNQKQFPHKFMPPSLQPVTNHCLLETNSS